MSFTASCNILSVLLLNSFICFSATASKPSKPLPDERISLDNLEHWNSLEQLGTVEGGPRLG